ncbi:MAG: DUF1553 domain-containing protein [Bacteroidota bacterium]
MVIYSISKTSLSIFLKSFLQEKYNFRFLCVSVPLCFLFLSCQKSTSGSVAQTLPDQVDFNFHIKPILSDRCFACHGPDEKAREAGLRLDIESEAFAALDSAGKHFAIVPGHPEQSELIRRITHTDPEVVMPTPESKLSLSNYEIQLIEKWIAQGAKWKEHWAYTAPVRDSLSEIARSAWPRNPIDYYTLAKMESLGLKPNPEASREKLIRRLSFDLTGLPPTLEEIEEFVSDSSPKAYENLVDRLLTQQGYGERMAMEWLDLARYADSHGYQDDLERSMWPWRDWVISAFNENLPYDTFVSWQLAGDLLESPTYAQKLATGFNRNHKITQEVGVINEEYRVTYVLDRVNTFSSSFLGMTIECAQCHDHKYDPISQEEYYSLFHFFNQVPEKGRVDYGVEVAEPSLPLPEKKVAEVETYINNLFGAQLDSFERYVDKAWQQAVPQTSEVKVRMEELATSAEDLIAWYPLDFIESQHIYDQISGKKQRVYNELLPIAGKYSGGVECVGTNYASLGELHKLELNQPFSLSFWLKNLDGGIKGTVFSSLSQQRNTLGDRKQNFVFQIDTRKGLVFQLTNVRNKSNFNVRSKETIPQNEWVHIVATYDGSGNAGGVRFYMNGDTLQAPFVQRDELKGRIGKTASAYLATKNPLHEREGKELDQRAYFSGRAKGLEAGQLDEFMVFRKELSEEEVQALYAFNPIERINTNPSPSEVDVKRLFFNRMFEEDAQFNLIAQRLKEFKIRQVRMNDIVLKPTMVMADMDTVRPTFILDRGQYDLRTKQVHPGTPDAILAFDTTYAENRLGLAKWLFSDENPLTARVAVNRYWQMVFGQGIVATPGDFGSQGNLPTHPELLDWLAVDFQESGWDLKRLMKMMVMSATYRQSVNIERYHREIDPENMFLARGPQVRLSAEMVRDHALSISGLLSPRLGGPSVKPYQPPGLWLEVASGNQSLRKYIQDHGEDLYRRSLYSFWKRTLPPPSMKVFDAPSREECTLQRRPTNTPMQALVLLNDPQFIEASRLIAARMIKEGGESSQDRIQFAFRLATSRMPTGKEIHVLQNLFEEELTAFSEDEASAKELLSIGEYEMVQELDPKELAAYTVVANAIINLTEAILK